MAVGDGVLWCLWLLLGDDSSPLHRGCVAVQGGVELVESR